MKNSSLEEDLNLDVQIKTGSRSDPSENPDSNQIQLLKNLKTDPDPTLSTGSNRKKTVYGSGFYGCLRSKILITSI